MNNGNGEDRQHQPDMSSVGLMFDPMEQMRELLFGVTKRETERQLSVLEAKLDDTRKEFIARFEALDTLVLELSQEGDKNRLESIADIGGAIAELGDRIKAMGAKGKA
jgi:hypothetical protein